MDDLKYIERMRPKGYNKIMWVHFYREAEKDKEWALDIIQNKPEWSKESSVAGIKMLGSYLYFEPRELAKQAYDYSFMRASGEHFLGALDNPTRELWETLTKKKIKKFWKYDHTKSITSAKYINKEWKV